MKSGKGSPMDIDAFLREYEALCRRAGVYVSANDDGEALIRTVETDYDNEPGEYFGYHMDALRADAEVG